MDWKGLGEQLFKKGLPLLGGLLGGPAGALGAKAAVSLVSSALGLKEEDATPDKILERIEADPQALIDLKKAEMAHKERLQALLLEEKELELKDIADARARERAIVEATGKKDVNLYVLAYLFVSGFFITTIAMSWLLILGKIPEDIPQGATMLLGMLFGTLTAGVGAIMQYFFGSSKSSKEKTELLAQRK